MSSPSSPRASALAEDEGLGTINVSSSPPSQQQWAVLPQAASTTPFNKGLWSKEEEALFEEGLVRYGRNNKMISQLVGTRSVTQVMAKKEYRVRKNLSGANPHSLIRHLIPFYFLYCFSAKEGQEGNCEEPPTINPPPRPPLSRRARRSPRRRMLAVYRRLWKVVRPQGAS